MDRPSLLVFVRHAESERNAAKKNSAYFADEYARSLLREIPDQEIKLTEEGIIHAQKTGILLREKFGQFDYAYHSGFERTIATLENILLAYPEEMVAKTKVCENFFIRERHAGYTYDMTRQEAEAAFPYLREYWRTHGWFMGAPPGGESLADVCTRVYLFIDMLFRYLAGKRILVVTHGGTLRCIRYVLEEWSCAKSKSWPIGNSPKNCGITYYSYSEVEKRLVLEEYNLTV